EDPQFRAREMLLEQVDPEFGDYIGPGIVPKFSGTPCEVRWSAAWNEGSHNAEVYGGLLGLSDDAIAELSEAGVVGTSPSATSPRGTAARAPRRRSCPRHAPSW